MLARFHLAQGLIERGIEVVKVDRLGDKVEGPPVHGGADVGHIAVGRDNDDPEEAIQPSDVVEQRQAVHARHVDVRQHYIDGGFGLEIVESLDAVSGEGKDQFAAANTLPKLLADQKLQVRFIIDDQDGGRHRRAATFVDGETTPLILRFTGEKAIPDQPLQTIKG